MNVASDKYTFSALLTSSLSPFSLYLPASLSYSHGSRTARDVLLPTRGTLPQTQLFYSVSLTAKKTINKALTFPDDVLNIAN